MSAPVNADYQMQISGMMGSNRSPSQDGSGNGQEDDPDMGKRKKLNIGFGNNTGIPSALGMTGGGGTTKY